MNDRETVALQLGREPAPFRVAARCPTGSPSVIENERGREMPTTFWITCPALRAAYPVSKPRVASALRKKRSASKR